MKTENNTLNKTSNKGFMKIKTLLLTALLATGTAAHADEGMWPVFEQMQGYGFALPYENLYSSSDAIKNAVVNFSGYCSGVVVSPDGLVFTNHHCGFEAIRSHSTVEHDYMLNGFYAKSYEEELPNENMFVSFMVEQKDITDYVNGFGIQQMSIGSQEQLLDSLENAMSKEVKANDSTLRLEIKPFYEGNRYYATTYRDFTDLRLVFTIPKSMGKYGGETDNWMWPRQTCDFSVFRIYADPKTNGPAEYSKDNVPYHPEHWAPVSLSGYKDGDFAMTMGYPGSTERYLSSYGIHEMRDAQNAPRAQVRGIKQDIMIRHMRADEAVRIKYDSKYAQSSNYWKNSIGMNKAIIDNDVLSAKAEIEKKYAAFAQGKPEYEGVVEKIDAIIEKSTPTLRQLYYTNEALRGAIEFGSTYLIMDNIKKALEEKNDSLLQASKKQLENAYDGIHNKDYDHEVDRAVAKAILPALAKALNANELPSFYQTINGEFKGDYDAYVDNIYDNSILSNRKNLDKFLAKPTVKAIEKDPATAYSRSKNEKLQELGKQYMELESGMELLHKAYIRGLGEMKQPVPSYPDANFTMRLTYGNVKSYSPRDAVHYDYYTTTDGILEKENPEDREFVVPAKLKELIQKKDFGRYAMADGTMPVCFLTTNDITGGNSGSPVINGEGQLIGTAFDGNWESLSGDINFNNDLQRCIALDIRYVLFILDKLGNCGHLINEMHIVE